MDKPTPMMAQYMAIKNNHAEHLLFYRMGDFYELFMDDAVKASQLLNIQLTQRNEGSVPMCGVPVHAVDAYLAKLIQFGQKVAICEQMESPSEAKKLGKKLLERRVVRVVTAGTLTEENLLPAQKPNYLLSIFLHKNQIHGAFADISTLDSFVFRCPINALASELYKIAPAEILIDKNITEHESLIRELKDFFEVISPRASHQFDANHGKQAMQEIYGIVDLSVFGEFQNGDFCALDGLIHYLRITQLSQLAQMRPPKILDQNNQLMIDYATRKSLELTQNMRGEAKGSLFYIINQCQTKQGSRLLFQHFNQPLTDYLQIQERLEAVQFFLDNPQTRANIQKILQNHADLARVMGRIAFGRANPRDLAMIRDSLAHARPLKLIFSTMQSWNYPKIITNLLERIAVFDEIIGIYNSALGEELPINTRDGGFIAPNYHKILDDYRAISQDAVPYLAQLEYSYREKNQIENLKIKSNNIIGYFIEIPTKFADKVPDEFLHKQTISGLARYSTDELQNCAQKIAQASEKAIQCEIEIFAQLCQIAQNFNDAIMEFQDVIAAFDVLCTHGENAQRYNLTKPICDNSLDFEIVKGRHLAVEIALRLEGQNYIANNCSLNQREILWLITGPNMAGKSTFLRQNALIVILAQMGSFVPAESAKIGIVDKLFSRVGAADDLTRGQSTFMVEMLECATILNRATPKSFVIMDEVGRGTANCDGLSLASAIIEYLHNQIACRALFATHYHELAQSHEYLAKLANYSLKILEHNNKVSFMHEIIAGAASRSYGIYVAQLAGLPKAVIKRAQQIADKITQDNLSNTMPLFGVAEYKSPNNEPELNVATAQNMQIINEISELNCNEMSPKQALEMIFAWNAMLKPN